MGHKIERAKPLVIAHRGARSKAPENTIQSILAALRCKPFGIEFDVDLTRDNIPIVIHQETLEPDPSFSRLIPAEAKAERAWSEKYDYDKIKNIDAGSWFSAEFSSAKIPTLAEILQMEWQETLPIVELKDPHFWGSGKQPDWPKKIVAAVLPLLKRFAEAKRPMQVLSFNPQILAELTQHLPQLEKVQAYSTKQEGKYLEYIECAQQAGCSAIAISELRITREPIWAAEAHKKGLKIYIYERTPAFEGQGYRLQAKQKEDLWKKLLDLKVDAIETDFVEELSRYLE